MPTMKTPGVYIVEKNAFPNSVVEVPTAVPAFIGYTEKAINGTETLQNKPWRITSMAEYHRFFGNAPVLQFTVAKKTEATQDVNVKIAKPFSVCASPEDSYQITPPANFYTLYYNILLFYANGGGPCYVVSVGDYRTAPNSASLVAGIDSLIKEQEPTLLVIPEAVNFKEADCQKIQQAMLNHCGGKMKNRFAILDVWNGMEMDSQGAVINNFREAIGSNFLSYGASYFPWLETSVLSDQDINEQNILWNLYDDSLTSQWPEPIKKLIKDFLKTKEEMVLKLFASKFSSEFRTGLTTYITNSLSDDINKSLPQNPPVLIVDLTPEQKAEVKEKVLALDGVKKIISDLNITTFNFNPSIKEIKEKAPKDIQGEINALLPWEDLSKNQKAKLTAIFEKINETIVSKNINRIFKATAVETKEEITSEVTQSIAAPEQKAVFSALKQPSPELHTILSQNWDIYKNVLNAIKKRLNLLPPSAAMAGIYTLVDNSRGVWKAPANLSISNVVKPSVNLTQDQQEDLNMPLNGKAVNAIRFFTGEGVKIWGARTMDGNSQDWRYVNVRRTLIFLEESIKNAARAYVFEPNVANTWISLKGMIDNFLKSVWKRGGLAGSSPEDAFSVHVGLGDTMTPDDILDGILRITVLVAISHPAEFIEITFQQQMQKS